MRLDRWGIPALAFLVTVAYWPLWYQGALTPRWIVLSLGTALLIFWADFRPNWTHVVGAAGIVCSGASVAWATSSWDAVYETWKFAVLGGVFCLGSACRDPSRVYAAFAAGICVSALVAVGQAAGWWVVPEAKEIAYAGLFGNKNWFGEAAAMAALGCFAAPRGWRGPLLAACAAALVLAQARGALLGTAVGLAVLTMSGRVPVHRAVVGITALTAAVAIFLPYSLFNATSAAVRLDIWGPMIENLRLFGWGAGSLMSSFPLIGALVGTRPEYAHNEFLNLIFEFGVASAFFFAIVLRAAFGSLPTERSLLFALLAIGCFSFPFRLPATAFMGAFVAGRLCAGCRSVRELRAHWRTVHVGWFPRATAVGRYS